MVLSEVAVFVSLDLGFSSFWNFLVSPAFLSRVFESVKKINFSVFHAIMFCNNHQNGLSNISY